MDLKFSKTDADAANKVQAIANGAQSTFCGTYTSLSSVKTSSTYIPIAAVDYSQCESSTITEQVITLSPVRFNNSDSQKVPAFTDSIDATGTYSSLCGEKRLSLEANSPAYLSIVADLEDPVTKDFSVSYDHTKATEADIGTHTIDYTVSSVDYQMIPAIKGTFRFTIEPLETKPADPDPITSSSVP